MIKYVSLFHRCFMCCLHVHKITKKRTFLVCRETYLGDRSAFVLSLIDVIVKVNVVMYRPFPSAFCKLKKNRMFIE